MSTIYRVCNEVLVLGCLSQSIKIGVVCVLVGVWFDSGHYVVLKDKVFHVRQCPEEDERNCQVLHPGPLQPLPESRSVRGDWS